MAVSFGLRESLRRQLYGGDCAKGKRQARRYTAKYLALYREINVSQGCERCAHRGLSNFLPLALFSFCSSIKTRNIDPLFDAEKSR